MGLVTLDDKSARLECMLFTEAFEKFGHLLEKDRILICEGEVSYDDFSGGNRMTIRNIIDISEARSHFALALEVDMHSTHISADELKKFGEVLEPWRNGTVPVVINYSQQQASAQLRLSDDWQVNPADDLVLALQQLLGPDKIRILF